jgi:MFS family permease
VPHTGGLYVEASELRRLLALVGAVVFVDTIFFAALTPLLPHYAHELGLSKAGAGVLQAAYPAGSLIGALPAGFVAARLGVKPTVLVGLCSIAVTSVLFGFADSVWQLDGARLLQGLSSGFTWTGSLAWLVAAAPARRRGELIGTVFGLAIAGALFGPVLGGVASKVGTGPAFSAVAAAAVAQAVWALRTPSAAPDEPQPVSYVVAAFRDRRILAGSWFTMLPAILFSTLGVLGPLRLSDLGFGSLAIGATWLVSAGLEAILSPMIGRVSDRRGRLLPIAVGLGCSALVLLVLPWPRQDWLLAVLVVCAGLSFGSFWTPAMSLLADSAESRGLSHGWGFAILNLSWAPGQTLGASAGGAVAKATSDKVVYLGLAAICATSLIGLLRKRRL